MEKHVDTIKINDLNFIRVFKRQSNPHEYIITHSDMFMPSKLTDVDILFLNAK